MHRIGALEPLRFRFILRSGLHDCVELGKTLLEISTAHLLPSMTGPTALLMKFILPSMLQVTTVQSASDLKVKRLQGDDDDSTAKTAASEMRISAIMHKWVRSLR